MSTDLEIAYQTIYRPNNLIYTSMPVEEKEIKEYSGCIFLLNDIRITFRVAKITERKNGLFVTLWKRIENGPIRRYNINDAMDLVVIFAQENDRCGQFVFTKTCLVDKSIVSSSSENIGGKRAFRIYPLWTIATSSLAAQTKAWQGDYFIDMTNKIDNHHVQRLFA